MGKQYYTINKALLRLTQEEGIRERTEDATSRFFEYLSIYEVTNQ